MNKLIMLCTMALILLSLNLTAQTAAQKIQTSYSAEYAGNFVSAIEAMKSLEQSNTTDPFYKLRLGWLYYSAAQYTLSQDYYQRSYELMKSCEAMEGILNCSVALGKWDKTVEMGNLLLSKYPNHFFALTKTAYAYYMQKNYASAVTLYKKIMEMYPFNLEAEGYLISAQVLSGNINDAKATYNILKVYSPANPFVLEYAKQLDK